MPPILNNDLEIGMIDPPEIAMRAIIDDQHVKDVAESIAQIGLIQPITVEEREGRFLIHAGHVRYLAHKQLGRTTIRAIVYQPGEIQGDAAKFHENLMRRDVTAAEEAIAYISYLDKNGNDIEALARLVHRSEDYINDRLALVEGDQEILNANIRGEVGFAIARELNKISDDTLRRAYLQDAIRCGVNYQTVKGWVSMWKGQKLATEHPASAENGAAQPAAHAPVAMACFCCGGSHLPHTMENVFVHGHERKVLEKLFTKFAQGEITL